MEEIDLVGGSISSCDNQDFGVRENVFQHGRNNCLSNGFSNPVLMEKGNECMENYVAASVVLSFFCCV